MTFDLWQACLTFALLGFLLMPTRRLTPGWRLSLLLGLVIVSCLPANGLPLSAYLRGLTDDLAITTLIWMGWVALRRLRGAPTFPTTHHWQLVVSFSLLGLALYPATLGLSDWDPYRLGYQPRFLMAGIAAITLLFWWRRNHIATVMLTAATAIFLIDVKSSDNYWDYLVDPFLVFYCWTLIATRAAQHSVAALRRLIPQGGDRGRFTEPAPIPVREKSE